MRALGARILDHKQFDPAKQLRSIAGSIPAGSRKLVE